MYKLIRGIHLCIGLFACSFLLMYGVSAVQMSHSRWFRLKPATQKWNIPLPAGTEGTPRAIATELIRGHGVRGELRQVSETAAGSKFRIIRPGTVYAVEFNGATRRVDIETQTSNFIGMLNRIHHVAGMNHDYAPINWWGALLPLISLVLLMLGVSGILLWFHLYNERRTGIVLLAGSLTFALTLIVAIRMG